jgi:hypothetical protein
MAPPDTHRQTSKACDPWAPSVQASGSLLSEVCGHWDAVAARIGDATARAASSSRYAFQQGTSGGGREHFVRGYGVLTTTEKAVVTGRRADRAVLGLLVTLLVMPFCCPARCDRACESVEEVLGTRLRQSTL